MKASNYDKRPRVDLPGVSGCAWRGWGAIAVHLREEMSKLRAQGGRVLAIECYTGVFEAEIRLALREAFGTAVWIDTGQAFLSSAEIDRLVAPDLGGDDPVFGYLSRLTLDRFFSAEKLASIRSFISVDSPSLSSSSGPVRAWPPIPTCWSMRTCRVGKRRAASDVARSRTSELTTRA